jgi:hypothetical protein
LEPSATVGAGRRKGARMVDRAGLEARPKPVGVARRWRRCVAASADRHLDRHHPRDRDRCPRRGAGLLPRRGRGPPGHPALAPKPPGRDPRPPRRPHGPAGPRRRRLRPGLVLVAPPRPPYPDLPGPDHRAHRLRADAAVASLGGSAVDLDGGQLPAAGGGIGAVGRRPSSGWVGW